MVAARFAREASPGVEDIRTLADRRMHSAIPKTFARIPAMFFLCRGR
jgi:hypothetical protein